MVHIAIERDAHRNVTGVSATSTGGEVTAAFIDPLETMNLALPVGLRASMQRGLPGAGLRPPHHRP